MYPAGGLAPRVDAGAEVGGATAWANRDFGSNNASAIANHHPCIPVRKRFKPCLKPERSPNADLIIFETEEIVVAEVLAMQVIYPGAQPSGNQNVNRRFDKPVVVIPCRTDVPVSGEIVRVFIAGAQAEINALEQTLLK